MPADAPALQKAKEVEKLAAQLDYAKKQSSAKDGRALGSRLKRDEAERKLENAELKDAEEQFYDASGEEGRRRAQVRQLFRQLEKTMEWAENNYHHLTIDQQNTHLISVNAFWKDFAEHDPAAAFYTRSGR